MIIRYERPKGVLLMPSETGEFVLHDKHADEMREVLELLKREHWDNCFGRVGYDGSPMVCSTCDTIDKYAHYLEEK